MKKKKTLVFDFPLYESVGIKKIHELFWDFRVHALLVWLWHPVSKGSRDYFKQSNIKDILSKYFAVKYLLPTPYYDTDNTIDDSMTTRNQ